MNHEHNFGITLNFKSKFAGMGKIKIEISRDSSKRRTKRQ